MGSHLIKDEEFDKGAGRDDGLSARKENLC
jgi:hypothetical protein